MVFDRRLHRVQDLQKSQLSPQEPVRGLFIGGVHDRGNRTSRPRRGTRQRGTSVAASLLGLEKTIGTIELEYPVSKKSRLFLQLSNSTSLPLGLASRWGRKETRFVIPPDTPDVADPQLETLHFLLGVLFRTVILRLDSCD